MATLKELKVRLLAVVADYNKLLAIKKQDEIIIGNDNKEVKVSFDKNGNLDLSQANNLGEQEKEALIALSKSPVGKEQLEYMIKTDSKITIKSYPYIAMASKDGAYVTVAGWHVITSVSAMAGGVPIVLKKGDSKGQAKSCTIHLFEGTLKYKMLQKSDSQKAEDFLNQPKNILLLQGAELSKPKTFSKKMKIIELNGVLQTAYLQVEAKLSDAEIEQIRNINAACLVDKEFFIRDVLIHEIEHNIPDEGKNGAGRENKSYKKEIENFKNDKR
jgi:hypothetical protein